MEVFRPNERETIAGDMWGGARERRSRKTGAIACTATMLAVISTAGCGGTQSPPAVHLALTAPTAGVELSVSNVKVFGTVDPASAVVVVAGKHVHVAHGVFARWMTLRKGLSHIKVVATAAGYAPAKLDIAVRSSPSGPTYRRNSAPPSASEAIGTTLTPTGHRYDPRIQANLIRTCEAAAGGTAAAEASCECYLAHLEARVSEATLLTMERAFLKGEAKLPSWLRDAAASCRRT